MTQVKQDSTLSRRRELRLKPELDDALQGIADRRGCSVSDVIREAAIDYFHLSSADGQTYETTDKRYKEVANERDGQTDRD